jgi:predicted transcriptional regulator
MKMDNGSVKRENILAIYLTIVFLMQGNNLPTCSLCIDRTEISRRFYTMAQSILEMATELTTALIQAGEIPPEKLQDTLQKTYMGLMQLKTKGENGAASPAPVDWRKSITRHAVTCLECGATYKQLSRHLREHQLDVRSYRSKHGLPRSQSLTARSITAMRRKIMQAVKPWEKAPRYVKAQAEKVKVAKKTGRKRVMRGKG